MRRSILVSLLIVFLTSCIGEDFIEVDTSLRARLNIIKKTDNNSDVLFLGDSFTYEAEYYNTSGALENIELTWTSSEPQYASIDQDGLVVSISQGVTVIKVTTVGLKENLSDERVLIVEKLERVELSAEVSSLFIGDSTLASAAYFDEDGIMMASAFSWASSNNAVAEVNSNGWIKAISEGQVDITATAFGVESKPLSLAIVTDTISPATVVIIADTTEASPGDTIQFRAEVKNSNGNVLPNEGVNWFSSDSLVVSINESGKATALKLGASAISASSGNANSNTFNVIVSNAITTSRSGSFIGQNGYRVNGDVEIRTTTNSNLELSFTNFSSQSGPDLYVYLGNSTSSGISIELLSRRSGSFTVQLPANIAIDDYDYVLIWCRAVNQAFGSAKLN